MAECFAVEFNGFGWQTVYPEKWAENSCTFNTVEGALADMLGVVGEIGDEANMPQHPDNDTNTDTRFYTVFGRMTDQEPVCLCLKATSKDDAITKYTEELWEMDGCPAEQRLSLEENGEGVCIDLVVQSDTITREV